KPNQDYPYNADLAPSPLLPSDDNECLPLDDGSIPSKSPTSSRTITSIDQHSPANPMEEMSEPVEETLDTATLNHDKYMHDAKPEYPNGFVVYKLPVDALVSNVQICSVGWTMVVCGRNRIVNGVHTYYKSCLVLKCLECDFALRPRENVQKRNLQPPTDVYLYTYPTEHKNKKSLGMNAMKECRSLLMSPHSNE
ncbi:hypothetical protein BG011_009915, partial [Mortierella polycephala]